MFLLHPLRVLYALVLPAELLGIAATGVLVVSMLPVYIVIICAVLMLYSRRWQISKMATRRRLVSLAEAQPKLQAGDSF